MKLIYAQGACSLSVHILLEEMKADYQALKVSLEDKTVLDSYNPKSYVPALILDDGSIMTEAVSILQYLSLENHSSFFPVDPFRRAKCVEWLNYVSTELHKNAGPLFHRDELKPKFLNEVTEKIDKRLQFLDDHLKDRAFIMENDYTIADMYALAILRILEHIKIDLTKFQAVINYKKNLEDSLVIKKVLKAEAGAETETALNTNESLSHTYIRSEVRGLDFRL